MKVCFPVISNFSGGDVYFSLLAREVADQGHTTELRFYPHLMEFLPYNVLRSFLTSDRACDVVHTKAEYGWLFRSPERPLVVTLAHSVFDPAYDRYKSPLQRLYHNRKVSRSIARSLAIANRVVTVSHFSAQRITERFGQDNIRVIHNGVDDNFFRPSPSIAAREDRPTRLFFAGNCTLRKGFDLLAPILSRLGDKFVLDYTSGLRTRGRRRHHPRMHPLGQLHSSELLAAYQRCDIFLFPSRLEGFGYPVAEAMACGKAVVCTNYSSLPELIDEGRGGFLCPRDDVDAFADRIQLLAANPDLCAQMGAYNRAKVEKHFSLSRCAQQYIELYSGLL